MRAYGWFVKWEVRPIMTQRLSKLDRTAIRLEQALNRARRAKRGNITRLKLALEQARTEHLKAELRGKK
jgi:hypothetical protein